MKKYRVIIVEDERLPRLSLIQKLETYHPELEIADSCEDAESAVQSILKHRPDILFLDIQLQGTTSLDILDEIKDCMRLPAIIFTTAYSEPDYLLKAIKFSAIDYLLKPVNIIDLAQAVRKAEEACTKLSEIQSEPANKMYQFRSSSGHVYATTRDILYIKADGNYSSLHLTHGAETIFERLGEIEERLDKQHFIRAGRSLIVNARFIYKVNKKHKLCILKSPENTIHRVEVSEEGMRLICNRIEE